MSESSLPSIDLELPKKLQDASYRRRFFLAESSALIAKQLIQLRKRRGLTQKQLAEKAETGQPAISRAERADYRNWSFNALRALAEAMDARIRVLIEPAEDILAEYEAEEIPVSVPVTQHSADETEKALEASIPYQVLRGSILDLFAHQHSAATTRTEMGQRSRMSAARAALKDYTVRRPVAKTAIAS